MADEGLMDIISVSGFIWETKGRGYDLVIMATLKQILELIQYYRTLLKQNSFHLHLKSKQINEWKYLFSYYSHLYHLKISF